MAGKHVVVTGAGTGIGRAIALRLAREGASLTLLARGRQRLEETAASIDGAARVEACDIRAAPTGRAARWGAAAEAHGPIHALVAASGIGGPNGDDDEGGDRFDDIVQTNLSGTYYCVRALLRHLAPGPDTRHVVVISSILARIARARLHGVQRVEGRASRARPLVRGRARARRRPGQRDLPRLGRHRHGVAGAGCRRCGERRHAGGRLSRGDARGAARGGCRNRRTSPGPSAWLLSPDARGVTGQAIDQNGGAWVGCGDWRPPRPGGLFPGRHCPLWPTALGGARVPIGSRGIDPGYPIRPGRSSRRGCDPGGRPRSGARPARPGPTDA